MSAAALNADCKSESLNDKGSFQICTPVDVFCPDIAPFNLQAAYEPNKATYPLDRLKVWLWAEGDSNTVFRCSSVSKKLPMCPAPCARIVVASVFY
jgi:hypothetical protein